LRTENQDLLIYEDNSKQRIKGRSVFAQDEEPKRGRVRYRVTLRI